MRAYSGHVRPLAAVLLAALVLGGCGAWGQLDQANKEMGRYGHQSETSKSTSHPANTSPPSADDGSKGPGILARVEAWWKKRNEKPPPPPDPNERIVGCEVHGAMNFTLKSSCIAESGRIVEERGRPH